MRMLTRSVTAFNLAGGRNRWLAIAHHLPMVVRGSFLVDTGLAVEMRQRPQRPRRATAVRECEARAESTPIAAISRDVVTHTCAGQAALGELLSHFRFLVVWPSICNEESGFGSAHVDWPGSTGRSVAMRMRRNGGKG